MTVKWLWRLSCLIVLSLVSGLAPEALGASGSWTSNGPGNWSSTNNWAGGIVADGAGSTAWFTNAISQSRTVTNDGISRTLGIVNLGAAGGLGSFTLAANAGLKLTLNNSGANAQVNQNSASKGDVISLPLVLVDSLDIANDSATKALTLSGAITSVVAGARTISNGSTGSGGVTISGVITNGLGPVSVVQNSASCPLTLGGANGFTNGLRIKAGTVYGITSANAFGTINNIITLGDSSGSQDVSLGCGGSLIFVQPILVAGGNTGMASLTNTATVSFNGPVTLQNHDLKVFSSASSTVMGGGITGTGTLLIAAVGGSSGINITTLPVNHAGAITNCGAGPQAGLISGGVGSNVTAITQDSTNSALNITGLLSVNSAGTTLANNNPTGALLTVSGGVRGAGNLVLNNNGGIPYGITLSAAAITNTGRIINSGSGTGITLVSATIGSNVTGVTQDSGTSPLLLSGANAYTGGTEIVNGTLLVTNVAGSATGPGAVTVYKGGTLQGNGLIAGVVTNRHGGTLSPGFAGIPGGTLTVGSLAWNGGGVYRCKIASIANNETGAGTDYDQLVVTNSLTAVPGGSNLVIQLDSLEQTLAFQTNRNYSLKLISCGKSAVLSPSDVTLDTNDFRAGGFWFVTNLNKSIYAVCLGNAAPTKNYWRGTGNWSTATNWSLGHVPQPGEDVEFDFQDVSNCTADVVSNNLGSLTLAAGYTGTLIASNLTIVGDCVLANGVVTHAANGTTAQGERYKLTLNAGGNLTVLSNGLISVDGKGYAAGNGPGCGTGAGGGSYGGRGCPYYHTGGQLPGPTYGSIIAPTNLGSGGNNAAGGGAIRLIVAGTTTVHGAISAGAAPNPLNERSGSGGSVFLTTGLLAGKGILKAYGGEAPGYGGNSGGGGRIAVVLTNSADTGEVRMQAYATAGRLGGTGAGGTVYVETTNHVPDHGRFIVDYGDVAPWNRTLGVTEQNGLGVSSYAFAEIILTNGGVLGLDTNDTLDITGTTISGDPSDRFDGLYVNGGNLLIPAALSWTNYFIGIGATNTPFAPASLTVGTNATLKMDVPWTVAFPFTLEPGGWLSHSANSTNEAYKINLTFAGNLDIPAGAQINVEGMGYGNGFGPGTATDAGGHGGMGSTRNGTGGTTYGSLTAPRTLGSGGGGAPGGGAVLLTVAGTATVNGVISAANAVNTTFSTGAGGSVYLKAAAVKGNGIIRVNSVATSGNASSGGGGRIAVILTNASDFAGLSMQACAGGGSATYSGIGGAGTIYLQTAEQGPGKGTLIIDASNRYWSTTSWLGLTLISSQVTDTVVGSVILTNGAIVKIDTNQALTVNGSWTNAATFIAATNSTVTLAGSAAATLAGSNVFCNLVITNADKTVSFQAGRTNLVTGLLKLGATAPGAVTLQSTVDGSWWFLNLASTSGATQQIARVSVKDGHAGGGQPLVAAKGSYDGGHNVNWFFPRIGGTVILVR